ncbi:MAG TPA: T9SS type A sorting domain-containing protein, partial [Bacteroidia bacterium]|nr:T9SS type A sorting domain-containing protein [Bacteroidia bacterium]
NLVWQKSIDVGFWSFIYGSCALPDSGFILCGQTYFGTPNGSSDAYLMRIDKNGDTLWTKHYGGIQDDIFNSVCLINNKLYAVGSNATNPLDTMADGWVVKLDMNGNKLQEAFLTYGYHQAESLNGITNYNDSSFIVCGKNYHNFIDSSATTGLVERYDTSLVIIDSITIRTNQQTYTNKGNLISYNKVVNISHSNICLIGYAIGGNGGTNMFFDVINSSFGWFYESSRHEGGFLNDYGYSGTLTSDGRVIGVGSTLGFSGMSSDYCTDANLGLEDIFLARFDSDSIPILIYHTKTSCFADTLFLWQTSIKNYTSNFTAKLFPNPVSNYTQLEITCNEQKNFTAKVYSILGNEIMSEKIQSNNPKAIDFSNFSEGSYFIKIQDENGQNISVLKFIISK